MLFERVECDFRNLRKILVLSTNRPVDKLINRALGDNDVVVAAASPYDRPT
jgi:hypothetical protein